MHVAGDADLKIYGIFGHPLAHTASPAIQNCALDHYRMKAMYFSFERSPNRFRYLMQHLKSFALEGFNITVPFKEAVIPYLSALSPEARDIGAVNTVKKEGRGWCGYNTDLYGFLEGLRERQFKPRGKRTLILGSGGSAQAVGYALAQKGAREIVIAGRTRANVRRLVSKLRKKFRRVTIEEAKLQGVSFQRAVRQAQLIVNATKVGLRKQDRSLIPSTLFPKRKILVYDLIYRPRETTLLKIAKRQGHRTQNGETMLVAQGAKAFEIWTGRRAPVDKMRSALRETLRAD